MEIDSRYNKHEVTTLERGKSTGHKNQKFIVDIEFVL